MRLKNIQEINGFRSAVYQCQGNVWLESPQGDKYNLKSPFSYYIALSELLRERGNELEIFCQLPTDEQFFYEYFQEHPEVL